ncbi:helix-turn-helix domain-containing protein [Mycobacteroides abscessus]|uniref:helix-turn-helix domain-containing protein n=1 Tax=Mycobacteroides abscessus TaxID=36809 RepID=UPI0026703FB6|nr:helix-turn-helix domain-containing protein [Mycobacteroides abscessus]MDO3110437.1 helix-turn-helix domain-containing protein [Mycobacteroides abscessus subsp. abscessus]
MSVTTRTLAPTPAALIPPTVDGTPTQTVSLRTAARMLGRHERTLRRWINASALPATRTPGGHISIRVSDLNKFGTPSADPVPAPSWPLTDGQWLIRTALEPHDLLRFWSPLFDSPSEHLGGNQFIVRPPTGPSIVVEYAPTHEGDHSRTQVWQPTIAVDVDAADRLRENGFEVRDGRTVSPDGVIVDMVVTPDRHGIVGWNLAQVNTGRSVA